MPINCLSVFYKHIIQVENKNMELNVGAHKHTIHPQSKKWGARAPLAPPQIPTLVNIYIYIYIYIYI